MARRHRFSTLSTLSSLFIGCSAALSPQVGWSAGGADSAVTLPGCDAISAWARGFDGKDEWQVNALSNRHRFAKLFVSEETTRTFGKPMLGWSEADVQAVRGATIECRRKTKDRELSGRYNGIQSTLAGRIANFVKAVGPARESATTAMAALQKMPPSPDLLRLNLALAKAGSAPGYSASQRAASNLSMAAAAAAAPARQLLSALQHLPEDDIAALVTQPAERGAAAMRQAVVDGMVADAGGTRADPNGLVQIERARQRLATDFADVLRPEERQRVEEALALRRDAIGEEIAGAIVAEIAKSSTRWDDAFADIDRRSARQLAAHLPPGAAERIREAADARRKAVAGPLYDEFSTQLGKLAVTEASLGEIDAAVSILSGWPASAADQAPRFRHAAAERRTAILDTLNRKEAGAMSGRTYQSADGTHKLEFVDGKRVLVSALGHTQPGAYVEEKDGRVSIESVGMAVTLTREGRMLRGWDAPLMRAK